ncbi:MAG: HD-GYP domain-containing protein [Gemmatimonadota bacterium]
MRRIHIYVLSVAAAGMLLATLLPWGDLPGLTRHSWLGFGALLGLGLLAESLAYTFPVGRTTGTSSILFIPILAAVVLFGPSGALVLIVIAGGIGEFLFRRKPLLKGSFNVAQYTLSTSAGGLVYEWAGGSALIPGMEAGQAFSLEGQLAGFVTFGVTFLILNHAAVTGAIAIDGGWPWSKVWATMTGPAGTNIFYDLLVSPLALLVAYLYAELWLLGLLVTILPLVFVRYSYLSTHRLQQANRDLLTVLVKAIETRDPYTSGHSLRVADLSERVARDLGCSERKVLQIRTAALLHDIGKIDVSYQSILQKPGSLTDRERAIIESHVIKGVHLLQSLTSVSDAIIRDVRHHHEAFDGTGYPDGISGTAIPLGARVIKACDAVDAMLSDRPYRKALTLGSVRKQLDVYTALHFDPEVVAVITTAGLLEEHCENVKKLKP